MLGQNTAYRNSMFGQQCWFILCAKCFFFGSCLCFAFSQKLLIPKFKHFWYWYFFFLWSFFFCKQTRDSRPADSYTKLFLLKFSYHFVIKTSVLYRLTWTYTIRYDVNLGFSEAIFGTEKDIILSHLETCDACAGSGSKIGSKMRICSTCGGRGQVMRTEQTPFGLFSQVIAFIILFQCFTMKTSGDNVTAFVRCHMWKWTLNRTVEDQNQYYKQDLMELQNIFSRYTRMWTVFC